MDKYAIILLFVALFACKEKEQPCLCIKVINVRAIRDSFLTDETGQHVSDFASVEIKNNIFDTVFLKLMAVRKDQLCNIEPEIQKKHHVVQF